MASVILLLRDSELQVEPGDEVSCVASVHNTGTIVEQFTLGAIGEAAEWVHIEPSSISLFPNTQQDVQVTFAPPRSWYITPGEMPFGIKVSPSNDPEGQVVEEGTLTILPFVDLAAELLPSVAMGKRKGKIGIAIDSRGNITVPAVVRGRDPSDTLVISVKPRELVLQPGTATFAKLKIAPRRRYLRGPQKQSRFKVALEPEDREPILLDATMIQSALLPKGSFAGLAILAALALWFLLIRPTVKNAAVSAIAPQIASSAQNSAKVQQQLKATQKSITRVSSSVKHVAADESTSTSSTSTTSTSTTTTTNPSSSSSSSSSSSTSTSTTSTSTSTTSTSTSTTTSSTTSTTTTTIPEQASGSELLPGPYSNAIPLVAVPGQVQQTTYTVPQGNTLEVTDIIMQNISAVDGSELSVGISTPTGTPNYFFDMSLSSAQSQDISLKTPLQLDQGYILYLKVSCAAGGTTACNTNTYYDGTVTVNS